MKLLLTSAGIKNKSIENALVDLLGKPIAESSALCIPTATYAMGGPSAAWQMITGRASTPLCELGWKSLGVLELTALPSLGEEHWLPAVKETDALLVCGGDVFYLGYWMRQSGLAGLLPSLRAAVYVGVSGGSMVVAPTIGEYFEGWKPPVGGDSALGMVDFSLFPHLDNENMPDFSMTGAEEWAAGVPVPGYAIDDQTAVKAVDGTVEVISEGHWKLFIPKGSNRDKGGIGQNMDQNEAKLHYAELVATIQEAQLKGAKMPYTSMNGNMYSYLGENGVALRLPTGAREEFLATYQTTLYHAHGIIQKEYVTVPPGLLATTDELGPYFQISFDYAKTLKPKATKRAAKP